MVVAQLANVEEAEDRQLARQAGISAQAHPVAVALAAVAVVAAEMVGGVVAAEVWVGGGVEAERLVVPAVATVGSPVCLSVQAAGSLVVGATALASWVAALEASGYPGAVVLAGAAKAAAELAVMGVMVAVARMDVVEALREDSSVPEEAWWVEEETVVVGGGAARWGGVVMAAEAGVVEGMAAGATARVEPAVM